MKLVEIKRGGSKIVFSQTEKDLKIIVPGLMEYAVERNAFFEAVELLKTVYKEEKLKTIVQVVDPA